MRPPPVVEPTRPAARPRRLSLVGRLTLWAVAGLVFVALLLAFRAIYTGNLEPQARAEARRTLSAISEMQTQQIDSWLRERITDGRLIRRTPYVGALALDVLAATASMDYLDTFDWSAPITTDFGGPDPAKARANLDTWLGALLHGDPYQKAILLDDQLRVRLVYPAELDFSLCEGARRISEKAVKRHESVMSNLHESSQGGNIHLELAIPIQVRNDGDRVPRIGPLDEHSWDGIVAGLLIVEADAEHFLFPLLESWPTASLSGETMLVRQEGDECLYLSPSRHRPGEPPPLPLPMTATDHAAVRVLLDGTNASSGLDYRGVPVLVAAQQIPGTTWFVVAKVDVEEALAPLRHQAQVATAGLGLLVLISSLGVALLWRRREAAALRRVLQAEHLRSTMAERVRQLMKGAHDIVLLIGEDLRVIETSDRAAEIYGYTPEEFPGLALADLCVAEEQTRLPGLLGQARAEDRTVFESVHRRRDGTTFPVEGTLTMVRTGGVIYYMGILRDVTERKEAEAEMNRMLADAERGRRALLDVLEDQLEAEEQRLALQAQLQQTQKLESIGTLAGGVAHEINNPIMGIMNYADLIQDVLDPESPAVEYVKEIGLETQRVATIVRNLLNFARADDSAPPEPRPIADMVESALSLTRTVLRHDQIALEVDVPQSLPWVICREFEIQQVVVNLITNARDALNRRYPGHDGNKKVAVRAALLEDDGVQWLRTTVEDHGCGIAPEVSQRMFEPFYTTKDRATGTGLGLAIVHGIVQKHGGRLIVDSELGEGTRCHLDLPVAEVPGDPQESVPEAAAAPMRAPADTTVLVVDDEKSIRLTLSAFLRAQGYQVQVAGTGADALVMLAEACFDVVLSDIILPRMTGMELLRRIRGSWPRMPVIMMTGEPSDELAAEAHAAGAVGFLAKPIAKADVIHAVAVALGAADRLS